MNGFVSECSGPSHDEEVAEGGPTHRHRCPAVNACPSPTGRGAGSPCTARRPLEEVATTASKKRVGPRRTSRGASASWTAHGSDDIEELVYALPSATSRSTVARSRLSPSCRIAAASADARSPRPVFHRAPLAATAFRHASSLRSERRRRWAAGATPGPPTASFILVHVLNRVPASAFTHPNQRHPHLFCLRKARELDLANLAFIEPQGHSTPPSKPPIATRSSPVVPTALPDGSNATSIRASPGPDSRGSSAPT